MRTRTALLAFALAVACSDGSGPGAGRPTAIVVDPDNVSLRVGHTIQMHALLLDATGDTIVGGAPVWSSSDTTILSVTHTGLVTARTYGRATITARIDTIAGAATLRVLVPVATISVSPLSATLVPGGNIKLTATLIGMDGNRLSDRDITWIVHGAAVAVSPDTGMVRGLVVGTSAVKAFSEDVTSFDSSRITVTQPVFTRLASTEASQHTCGLTAAGAAYCWGWNVEGSLGNGTFGDSIGSSGGLTRPTGVSSLSGVTAIATGSGFTCAIEGSPGPVSCWGAGDENKLGNGSLENRASPWRVLTTLSATAVVTGSANGCMLAVDSLAYCWGHTQPTPRAQLTARKYTALFAGATTVCGIALDSLAYCGSMLDPVLVNGSLRFTTLSVGRQHICGIAADSIAYCWGQNSAGQLGDSTLIPHATPAPVHGGHRFLGIAAGSESTCGIVSGGNVVYCWGGNAYGDLGRVAPGGSPMPAPVSGNLSAQTLVAGEHHACAIDPGQRVYCWGSNYTGQLGDGTRTDRYAPTLVAGQP